MMGHVSIKDDDEVSSGHGHPMDVSRSEPEFASPGTKDNFIGTIKGLKLLGHVEGPIRGAIIDDDDLKVIDVLAASS